MVRAILDERKTVTRRLIKPQPNSRLSYLFAGYGCGKWSYPSKCAAAIWGADYQLPDDLTDDEKEMLWTPPFHTDDILYVRETWQYIDFAGENNGYVYKTSENGETWETESENWKWYPSIHMPKEAARIFLKVKDVRVERLQEITSEQIEREGVETEYPHVLNGVEKRYAFSWLWNSTIKKSDIDRYGWDADPWVWVIEFECCEKPEVRE